MDNLLGEFYLSFLRVDANFQTHAQIQTRTLVLASTRPRVWSSSWSES
jgi:hypothetical protein